MKVFGILLITLLVCTGLAFAFPPHRTLVTTIRIAKPPSLVWAVLTDTGSFPAWNPSMVIKGALVPGNVIEHEEGSGEDRMVFHPVVVTVAPGRELSWSGHVGVPGFFDALHYFRLQADGDGTLFTQGEHLRGVALWAYNARQLLPGFNDMNAALKQRVEHMPPS